jgi:integrase/recombinase XerD
MGLTKQAKTLCKSQVSLLFMMLKGTRYPLRNKVIALLSIKAGLRAKEIANLTWDMITDAEGCLNTAIHLRNNASKGKSGRVIPLNKELRAALSELQKQGCPSPYVITTERSEQFSPAAIVNLFAAWFRATGLQGCSSLAWPRTLPRPIRTGDASSNA